MSDENVKFANPLSKALLSRVFEEQWTIPRLPTPARERLLKFYEKHLLKIDTSAIPIDRPIFIIALPRCGSSMLQDLMCTHPDMAYITQFMHVFRTCFAGAEMLRRKLGINVQGERFIGDSVEVSGASPADPVASWAAWLKQDMYNTDHADLHLSDFTETELENIREDIRRILWCFGGSGKRLFTKNPGLISFLGFLNELFPDAKFIHLFRDPRKSANSMIKFYRKSEEQRMKVDPSGKWAHPFVPYPHLPNLTRYLAEYGPESIETTARLWNDSLDYVDQCRPAVKNLYEVRFEDILADPHHKIEEIIDFCELKPMRDDNRAFHEKMAKVGVVRHQNPDYQGFERIEEICRDRMQQHGYG